MSIKLVPLAHEQFALFVDMLAIIEESAQRHYGRDVLVDLRLGRVWNQDDNGPRFTVELVGARTPLGVSKVARAFDVLTIGRLAGDPSEYVREAVAQMARSLRELERNAFRSEPTDEMVDAPDDAVPVSPEPVNAETLKRLKQMRAGPAESAGPPNALRFAKRVIEASWDHGEVSTFDIQDWATEAGLLVPTQMDAPCGEGCRCEEYDNIPGICYRFGAALRGSATPSEPTDEMVDALEAILQERNTLANEGFAFTQKTTPRTLREFAEWLVSRGVRAGGPTADPRK